MLQDIKILEIRKNIDERGFFCEVFRKDWINEILGIDEIVQANFSFISRNDKSMASTPSRPSRLLPGITRRYKKSVSMIVKLKNLMKSYLAVKSFRL